MKAYVMTTAVLFGLLTLAHIWRVSVEPHLARDPFFLIATLVAAALSVWGWRLLRVPVSRV